MTAVVPDPLVVEQYRRNPKMGPCILFFSGGTALRQASRELVSFTHNSIHLITPFDSGGSSAVLRKAFSMPAVGDIRNRLMALSDLSVKGNSEIFALFTHRLPKNKSHDELCGMLHQMVEGSHVLIHWIPNPIRAAIQGYLRLFRMVMPDDFDLRGASIGNLILTAGYLDNGRRMGDVIDIFSKLANVCGTVRPIVDDDCHLAARLEDGSTVVGQHRMTGKEAAPLASPIQSLWLTAAMDDATPAISEIGEEVRSLIAQAELICFPVGSFYTSLMANLLPKGVGEAVAANPCPKVFVPNTGHDPELHGRSVAEQVGLLRRQLVASGAPEATLGIDAVLVDAEQGDYPGGVETLSSLGLDVVDLPMITDESTPYLDGRLFSEALVSLV